MGEGKDPSTDCHSLDSTVDKPCTSHSDSHDRVQPILYDSFRELTLKLDFLKFQVKCFHLVQLISVPFSGRKGRLFSFLFSGFCSKGDETDAAEDGQDMHDY